MAYTAYAIYSIFFETQAEYDFAMSFTSEESSLILISPVAAAALFDLPYPPDPVGDWGPKGIVYHYPYEPGIDIKHPGASGVAMDPALDFMFVPGQTTIVGTGEDMNLYWCANILQGVPEDMFEIINLVPPRRWAIGWEGFPAMECHPQSGTGAIARDASRVVDGMGLKYRGENTGANLIECILSNSEGANLPSRRSWERFYFRIRQTGSLNTGTLWRCTGTASTASGARIELNNNNHITVYNVNGSGVDAAVLGSTLDPLDPTANAFDQDVWYKIDLVFRFAQIGGTPLDTGYFYLFINGVQIFFTDVGAGGVGLSQIQNHRGSSLVTYPSSNWEFDIDDWHNAEHPYDGVSAFLQSMDFVNGTHVRGTFITDGTAVNWTGIIPTALGGGIINQYINPAATALTIASTTALATINATAGVRDYNAINQPAGTGIYWGGPVTVAVTLVGTQAGGAANNGRLGYSILGLAPVLTTVALPGAGTVPTTETYLPDDVLLPTDQFVEPFLAVYEKGNSANTTNVAALVAFAQYVGVFGSEDMLPEFQDTPFIKGLLHNCRYTDSHISFSGPVPDAPACVSTGTYVGNGTFQEILLCYPCHILIIRNVTTGVPILVTTTSLTPMQMNGTAIGPAGDIPILGIDRDTNVGYFQVNGSGARVNQVGVTYRYFAFADPGMRYLINGEFSHGSQTGNFDNFLIDSTFTPEYGIFLTTYNVPSGLWFKGPMQVDQEVSAVIGTLITNGAEFSQGRILSGDALSEAVNPTAYSVLRTLDGSGLVMVQITSYVGNGTSPRNITLTPTSGRFPSVAFVTRRGGSQPTIYRDASHVNPNSINLGTGSNTTTGITGGGIDFITVSSDINVNGAEYSVLVFPGDTTAWAGQAGCFCAPNALPPGDFWEPPPEPPNGIGVMGDGGLILGGTDPITLLQDVSGIYTLTPGTHTDTLIDRQSGQTSIEVEIPDPTFKTGYIGG